MLEEANYHYKDAERQLTESRRKLMETEKRIQELTAVNTRIGEELNDVKVRAQKANKDAERQLAESNDKLLEAQQTTQEAEHRVAAAERRVQELSGDITQAW